MINKINIESIPVDCMRDELKKYYDIDAILITLERGFEYEIQ